MNDTWLDSANPADLEVVAQALVDGRIAAPFTASALQHVCVADAGALLESLAGTDPKVIAWMLRRTARERRVADNRYAAVASLAWSGASEGDQSVRDTRVVLDGLFARAERHVLISTFVVYNGRSVFAALGQRLRERPDLTVDLYMNLPERDGAFVEVAKYLETFARDDWPTDAPMPRIFYDPEVARGGAKRTTLHAKCVVIDDRWAFVTSANFTEAAQERNIEAGVLLDHPRIAEALAGRFRALREAGKLRRMERAR
jgi:phosphatidylserine/phosphatidylglycerophosphate/cardiolipin synthase-like enzyme